MYSILTKKLSYTLLTLMLAISISELVWSCLALTRLTHRGNAAQVFSKSDLICTSIILHEYCTVYTTPHLHTFDLICTSYITNEYCTEFHPSSCGVLYPLSSIPGMHKHAVTNVLSSTPLQHNDFLLYTTVECVGQYTKLPTFYNIKFMHEKSRRPL